MPGVRKHESLNVVQPLAVFSPENSLPPQLIEISPLPVLPAGQLPSAPVELLSSEWPQRTRLFATSMACCRSEKAFEQASTR